jgi:hypothetical protein
MIVSRRKPGPDHSAVMRGIARMRRFERERAAWVRLHPNASADEIRHAVDRIAAMIMPSA